ncbi:MAG TPA: GAF domain-containing protein [Pyrinomonadaceae bacterium]|nr:GAF domain-containing protein [Pyrinomonadaceae bacterium]
MFTSYTQPKPPKSTAGSKLIDQLPAAIYGFIRQSSQIREASLHELAKSQLHPLWERVISCGLVWGGKLLNAPVAANIQINRDELMIQDIHGKLSEVSPEDIIRTTKAIHRKQTQKVERRYPTIWYDGEQVVVAYSIQPQDKVHYFYFSGASDLSPTDMRLIGTFMRVFEDTLTAAVDVELLFDQRRLLHRRTIVAQLRPNDLLYQGLRRLHKYITWQRGALILMPSLPDFHSDVDASVVTDWHVIAERLWGVHDTSLRIGKRYGLGSTFAENEIITDLIINNLGELRRKDAGPWEKLVLKVLLDAEGLPSDLPRARSALVVSMLMPEAAINARTEDSRNHDTPSFLVILSDPRKSYFNRQHIKVTRELFSDINQIITKSSVVSERLVNLWKPLEAVRSDDEPVPLQPELQTPVENVDEVEALDDTMLAQEAPNVLSVDALQIVQLRRGAMSKFSDGNIDMLAVLSIKQEQHKDSDTLPVKLIQGTKPKQKITPESDLLWKVLTSGSEGAYKDLDGIHPKRLANLFSIRRTQRPYKTVFIAPIRAEGELAGAIIVYRRNPSEFADIDKLLIRSLAARVGERIDLHRQLADRARHNSCLSKVAYAKSPSQARRELVKGARELLNADYAFMMAAEESQGQNGNNASTKIIEVSHTWSDGRMRIPPIKAEAEGITGAVYISGQPLAVSNVSSYERYVPLHNSAGQIVPMASELAVPIKLPSSIRDLTRIALEHPILGVLDAMWAQRHEITRREVKTLSALAQHAAAVLQLTSSLQDAQQSRDKLHALLDKIKTLQSLQSETAVLNWLWSIISKLIDCDALYVWSHIRGSADIELFYYRGVRTKELKKGQKLPYSSSWNGRFIQSFRKSRIKSAYDRYDKAEGGIQISNTPEEPYEARLAYCIAPASPLLNEDAPETVWSICLYRFRPSNFDEREKSLLQLAAEYCEGTFQNLHSAQAQTRTLKLAATTRDIALQLVDNIRTAPDVLIKHILRRGHEELSAFSVSVLYYHEVGDSYASPTHYAFPNKFSRNPAPRPGGISETVRRKGKMIVVPDITNPPAELMEPFNSSPFLTNNPQIRAMIACPLYEQDNELSDDVSPTAGKFCGVLHINFDHPKNLSKEELLFVSTIQRFLTECGGLGATLTRMREKALQRVQTVTAPNLVFDEILKVALKGIRAELPSEITEAPNFALGGNIYMVESGDRWTLLGVRASVGKRSGDQAGRQHIGEGVVGKVAKSGVSIILNDTSSQQAREYEYLPYLKGMKAELAVPIKLQEVSDNKNSVPVPEVATGVIGVLNVECSHAGVFTARQQELLKRYASETPISLLLNLAERHGILLWEVRSHQDRFINHATALILHDLTKPIRRVAERVKSIRNLLSHSLSPTYLDIVDKPLRELEKESKEWSKLKDTGFLHLQPEILEARGTLDVVEQVREWANWHKLSVSVDGEPFEDFFIDKGHRELMGRVLENLYENSVDVQKKAGMTRGRIWIEMKLTDAPGHYQYLDIDFNDNGPGFENLADSRSNIFRHFSSRSSEGRWCFGLPCARQIMDEMGGEIDLIDSIPHKKTTFRLRFLRSILGLRMPAKIEKDDKE